MSEAYQFAIGRSRALVLAACFVAAAVLLFFAGTITGMLYSGNREVAGRAVPTVPAAKPPELPTAKASDRSPSPAAAPGLGAASAAEPPASGPAGSVTSNTTGNRIGSATTADLAAPSAPATAPLATSSVAPSGAAAAAAKPGDSAAPPAAASPALVKPALAAATASAAANALPSEKPSPAPAPVETSYAIPLAVRVGSFAIKSNADTLMQSLRNMGYQPAMNHYSDARGRLWYVVKLGP